MEHAQGAYRGGETAAEAAVREIQEETGIRGRVLAEVGAIDFWFMERTRRIHKTVQHFLLEYVGGELCGDDHKVSAVEWVPFTALQSTLVYPDERVSPHGRKISLAICCDERLIVQTASG